MGQPYAKILIVTPKKIGSAPVRNLLKRRLKSIFYEEKLYERPTPTLSSARKEVLVWVLLSSRMCY